MTALIALLFCQGAMADTSTTIVTLGDSVEMTLSTIIGKGLPVLWVETVDNEEPTCDYVSAPAGCMGASIANATKVPGRLVVYSLTDGKDSVLYDSGDYEKDVSGMTIKLRGNTSAYDIKKPYKIKLEKKFDLLFGDTDINYKDKEWVLLRDDYLTTLAGFKVNQMVGMTWTPRHHFVNVVMNGRYRGVYLLCESIKRNPDCRLNVDKNCGFIFEFDPYWWNEDVYVVSKKSPSYNYTFKYPDSDDITEEQLTYMQSLVNDYEARLKKNNYPDLIDVRSFAAWCLVHDIEGTKDGGGANMYFIKYDTTAQSKIIMPLAWDFDMAERTASSWSRSHIEHMTTLFNNSNRTFVGEFAALWRQVRGTLVDEFTSYMQTFRFSEQGVALSNSYALDKIVYGRNLSVFGYTMARSQWMTSRFPWLDQAITAMNPLGDVNVDGRIDITDATLLITALLEGDADGVYAADVNEDGVITITDVTNLIIRILQD